MQNNALKWCLCTTLSLGVILPQSVSAQDTPLSAIDWVNQVPQAAPVVPPRPEPETTGDGSAPPVSVVPLGADLSRVIGLVPTAVSGLAPDLWAKTPAHVLAQELKDLPNLTLPAAQALMFTLLLAETQRASGESVLFEMARVDALIRAGALEPALALLTQMGPDTSPAHLARFFDAALLNETENTACGVIHAQPHLAPDYAARIFCAARSGDWETAALLLGTARALGTISQDQSIALERFLDPDLFEDAAPLPRIEDTTPLMFRIYEALGQPIATRNLPIVFANSDLRDVTGWKSQLEAAERLAQNGALPGNQLLGTYSEREPAASGGIWDRVEAVQQFDTALSIASAEAVSKTLPHAWSHIKSARLSDPFTTLYASRLQGLKLTGEATQAALEMTLLAPIYEAAPLDFPDAPQSFSFHLSLAQGAPHSPETPTQTAIAAGFEAKAADPKTMAHAQTGQLGRALLSTLFALQAGADGDIAQLTQAIGNLRALGLEDTARRAGLQILLRAPQ